MVTALLSFAPAPKEAGLAGMDFVLVAGVLVNLAVFALLLWWMHRAVVALELIAKAQSFIAERTPAPPPVARKPEAPSPTRQILGCVAFALAIASSSGCSDDAGDDQAEGEGDGEGEGGTEPNGETTERACYILARCELATMPTCSDERSDEANELADQALVTCGPAPTEEPLAIQWDECMAEQCGCGGNDPATGERICE
jgi:hypothetical protein